MRKYKLLSRLTVMVLLVGALPVTALPRVEVCPEVAY